jgi:tRNA pseudouridine38-40 synthase
LSRICLKVSYKGTNFRGFAEQPGDIPTVAGLLRLSLERVVRSPLVLTCAGRTDAGVHAVGQVVTADLPDHFETSDLERLRRSVNKQIGPDVFVSELKEVDKDFDARFSAVFRRYRYSVLNSENADPLHADTHWWVREHLSVAQMNLACGALIGEHDFSAFCRRPDADASLTRRVIRAEWSRRSDMLDFEIQANAFCHQMVRSIVGFLVEVGRGRRTWDEMSSVLASKDRANASSIAPPTGLVLMEVGY